MNFLRNHWYDIGGIFAALVIGFVIVKHSTLTNYQLLLWLHLVSLFFHQLEEYRINGTFPGMINSILAGNNNKLLNRYPLNTNSAFYINVVVGWTTYFITAVIGKSAIWLGLITITISFGNIIAHTIIFNIKGKTMYNAGLTTCWLLFAPCIYFFFKIIYTDHLITITDYFIGIPLGIAFNYFGILKIIDLMKDEDTNFIFKQRNLLARDRKNSN